MFNPPFPVRLKLVMPISHSFPRPERGIGFLNRVMVSREHHAKHVLCGIQIETQVVSLLDVFLVCPGGKFGKPFPTRFDRSRLVHNFVRAKCREGTAAHPKRTPGYIVQVL